MNKISIIKSNGIYYLLIIYYYMNDNNNKFAKIFIKKDKRIYIRQINTNTNIYFFYKKNYYTKKYYIQENHVYLL